MRSLAWPLSVAFLAACSDDAPPDVEPIAEPAAGPPVAVVPREHVTIAAAAAKMLPRDVAAVVHVSSPAMVAYRLGQAADKFQPGASMFVNLAPLLSPTGLRERDLELTGDAAIGLRFAGAAVEPTIVIPSKTAEDAAGAAAMAAVAVGDYVALAPTAEPEAQVGALPLAEKMVAGDVSIRVDLKKVMAACGTKVLPFLDKSRLAAFDRTMPAAVWEMFDPILAKAKELLGAARRLDLALSFRDGSLVVEAVVDFDTGIWDDTPGGIELLQALPLRGANMVAYSRFDWTAWESLFSGALKNMTMPPGAGISTAEFQSLTAKAMTMYGRLGPETAIAYRVDPADLGVLAVSRGADPAAFQAASKDFFAAARQLESQSAGRLRTFADSEIDGMKFSNYLVEPPQHRPGTPTPTQMSICAGGANDLLFLATHSAAGGIAPARAAIENGKRFASPLLDGVRGLHFAPRVFVAMDFRSLLQAVARQAGDHVPDGAPVLVWLAAGGAGKRVEVQLQASLGDLGTLVSAIRKRR